MENSIRFDKIRISKLHRDFHNLLIPRLYQEKSDVFFQLINNDICNYKVSNKLLAQINESALDITGDRSENKRKNIQKQYLYTI